MMKFYSTKSLCINHLWYFPRNWTNFGYLDSLPFKLSLSFFYSWDRTFAPISFIYDYVAELGVFARMSLSCELRIAPGFSYSETWDSRFSTLRMSIFYSINSFLLAIGISYFTSIKESYIYRSVYYYFLLASSGMVFWRLLSCIWGCCIDRSCMVFWSSDWLRSCWDVWNCLGAWSKLWEVIIPDSLFLVW